MKVYISGPISNNPNYREQFSKAERRLRESGMHCFNPAKFDPNPDNTWTDYMRADISELLSYRAIYLLKGWRRSKGARLELKIAKALDYLILHE